LEVIDQNLVTSADLTYLEDHAFAERFARPGVRNLLHIHPELETGC
jgi:hypothetical protein